MNQQRTKGKARVFHTCLICGKTVNRIARHVRAHHGIDHRSYLIKYVFGGTAPKCGCGCGQDAPYSMIHYSGFKAYIKEHSGAYLKKNPSIVKNMISAWHESSQSKEANEKRSKSLKIHHATNPEHGRIISAAMTDRVVSASTREKMSATRKTLIASGDITINTGAISKTVSEMYVRGEFDWLAGEFITRFDGTICCRSSYELEFLKLVDSDQAVSSILNEWTTIAYTFDGRKHHYVPDFLITLTDGAAYFIEVKPYGLRNTSMNSAKRYAALDECKKNGWIYAEWSLGEQLPWRYVTAPSK